MHSPACDYKVTPKESPLSAKMAYPRAARVSAMVEKKSPDLRGSEFDTDDRGIQARFTDCEAVALTTLEVTSATALRFASVMALT